MRSEKTTREAMYNYTENVIYRLRELQNSLNDADTDLVDIDIELDMIDREYQMIRETLENCDEY